jgi:hypothetical protein
VDLKQEGADKSAKALIEEAETQGLPPPKVHGYENFGVRQFGWSVMLAATLRAARLSWMVDIQSGENASKMVLYEEI